MPANDPGRITGEAILSARNGDKKGALLAVDTLRRVAGDNADYSIAEVYAQLAEPDDSFAALDRAFKMSDWRLISLLTDPFMDPIRHDPRFQPALARLHYP